MRKVHYFRDLGGIKCANGKEVVYGKLFRSGHLGKLKEKSARNLSDEYSISRVVDLRSPSETKEVPDVVGDMEYYHRPPLNDMQNPAVTRKNRLGILKKLMAKEGGTKKHLCDTYRSMITCPESVEAYRFLISSLLEEDGGTLWHCTQGKDRTGLGSAIILMTLGADRDTILKDYLDYNKMCRFKTSLIFAAVTILKFSTYTARSLNNLMTASADYLNAAFEEIDRLYGSTEGFLKNALLLTDENILKLRKLYLA